MMNDPSVLDTEVNGSTILVDPTKDATESTTAEDDFESPVVSVLESAEASFPSPEELRNSHTSRSHRSIWTGASSPKGGAAAASTSTDRSNKKKVYCFYGLLVAVAVLVFLVIIPAVVVSKNNSKESSALDANNNSASAQDRPRPTYAQVVEYIVGQGISTESEVLSPDTPQNKAALWLMTDDPANIPVPSTTSDLNTYDGYRYMARYVMAVNYFAFNGTNWHVDLNWMSDLDVCDWNKQVFINGEPGAIGLFCFNTGVEAEDGTVTIKRIPNAFKLVGQVDGSIPRENGMLTTLALVQLAGSTGLTGSIPTELCQLTNLEGLYMNVNRLSSSIPSCLGDLRNLQVLNLAANELVGTIPPELCQLSKLEELHLTLNMIDGTIPSCIGSLPMAVLDLADNLLTGTIPSELGNLEETLSAFSADDNMLTGDPSDVFNKLVRLYHLTASSNRLNFTMESTFLENTRYLRYFDLSDNEIDGIFPVHLLTTDYQFLLVMDLSRNDLIGEFTDGLNIASPVRYLGAHDNRIKGSLENLVNLTSLIHLDVSNNQFTGSMEPAGALIHITNLFLSENPFDAGPIPESFGLLRNIQELSLRNTSLTGMIPASIAENWTIVELIDLGSNDLVGSIPKIFGDLLNLEYLLLFDNYGINGTVPAGFQNKTQMKGVLLDRTSINGTEALELFCALPNFVNVTGTELLIVDCDQQECTECEGCRCCNDAETSGCSKPQLGNIDGMWITNFRRPANEFNFTDELKVSDGS